MRHVCMCRPPAQSLYVYVYVYAYVYVCLYVYIYVYVYVWYFVCPQTMFYSAVGSEKFRALGCFDESMSSLQKGGGNSQGTVVASYL